MTNTATYAKPEATEYSVTHSSYNRGIQAVEIIAVSRKAGGYLKDKLQYTVRTKSGEEFTAHNLIVFNETTDATIQAETFVTKVLGLEVQIIKEALGSAKYQEWQRRKALKSS